MSSSNPDQFGNSMDSGQDSFNKTASSIGNAAIVSIVIGSIATIAIVIAIIYCLKKAGDAIPAYANAQVTLGVNNNNNKMSSNDDKLRGHLQGETMERFLSDMAREKPTRFSPQELSVCTRNFSQVLGSGGFGVVYKGDFPNGIQVAVKVLKENTTKKVEEQFMAEVGTMGRTYHINLVRLYGFCFEPAMQALVYEYMGNGALDKLLFGPQTTPLRLEKLHEIAVGIARGIAYLHEECHQRIIHYDIKPENVLLDINMNPKVADFGLAKLSNRDNTHMAMSGCRGTPGYAAPELWTPYPVTHKCDVYSFGMVLFEIVGRRRNHDTNVSGESREWVPKWAYDKFKNDELMQMLSTLGIDEDEREKGERMVKVALWCVQYLPNTRPQMSSVVRMLEGGVEIETPPNPFAHLEDNLDLNGLDSSYNKSSNLNSSSNVTNKKFEIQLVNTY